MIKRKVIKVSAVILAVLMPVLTASVAFAQDENPGSGGTEPKGEVKASKYDKLDINELTGHGKEPEDISVSAGATYQEKAWYEYVTYSDHAVASYRLGDDSRILFYDPYTYSNAMVMDVNFDANTTQFDTMSSYSVSHTTGKSISACAESTYTNSSSTQTSGVDVSGSNVTTNGSSKTTYNHQTEAGTIGTVRDQTTYKYGQYVNGSVVTSENLTVSDSISTATGIATKNDGRLTMFGIEVDVSETITIGLDSSASMGQQISQSTQWLTDQQEHVTRYGDDYKTTTKYQGDDTVDNNSTSATEGWTQLSARVTKTLGSSSSTSNSWTENESTTVTKTYAATHFASDGVTPLPWAIVHYRVQMPMKCCLQVKYSGEWVNLSTSYCLLTTVQGTCRAWMQNGQTYYEDWGNGEPVVETEFWSKFMTVDSLMAAYNDKLYPVGGDD